MLRTDDLTAILKDKHADIDQYFERYEGELLEADLGKYLCALLEKHGLQKKDLIFASGRERSYCYQLLNGTRRNPSRDMLLAIALGLHFTCDPRPRPCCASRGALAALSPHPAGRGHPAAAGGGGKASMNATTASPPARGDDRVSGMEQEDFVFLEALNQRGTVFLARQRSNGASWWRDRCPAARRRYLRRCGR